MFIPLLAPSDSSALIQALARVGPVVINATELSIPSQIKEYFINVDLNADIDQVISWLDDGAQKVIVPISLAKQLIGTIPPERLLLCLDVANFSAVPDTVSSSVSGVLLKTPSLDLDLISSIAKFFQKSTIYVLSSPSIPPTRSRIRDLRNINAISVLPSSQLTLESTSSLRINVAEAFLAAITSDRPDGLFPTIVSTQSGVALGLVYSSEESVTESILTGKGVYQSRKHGLWRKGETSGATQDVVSIRLDCDSDALEFRVVQYGVGFCHLDQDSCYGPATGLAALQNMLQSRFESAPEGSYTKRLFEDETLLRAKIMEEADELCSAKTPEEVAFEAADLFYFALTKCVAAGVDIADIEASLDRKAKKITRRPGNAKPQWEQKPQAAVALAPPPEPASAPIPDNIIRMRTADLASISLIERAQLLKRPVLNSSAMISKVKPIVEAVRTGGDTALLSLIAKFDRCPEIDSPVILPPFKPESYAISPEVKEAIDVAYANLRAFHKAQISDSPLVVETMPGVTCTRFSRPISRVGLYVPGGTAILPSTALHLGVPAQVANCPTIVLASPPRADGSISPEVMYVANLIGASAVLRAGGAQAVAAMAYGTESVPKVDKIFGPGNQWVTAAKMLVQNDTDALVSIDMPAGPSEVLVIADEKSNPAFVAADLLSQAEHGVDSQVVLVAVNISDTRLAEVEAEVDKQAKALPRVDIMRESISKSLIVKVKDGDEAMRFSNDYAPEHLILHLEGARGYVAKVENAGSVFVGPYTPESCGDYASGTNHTLPTNGYARQFSGVNTQSFQKHITSQEITVDGLKKLGPFVATLADCEGLGAHANAVRIRLQH